MIVDTPAAEHGADARVIAAKCGGRVALCRQGKTSAKALQSLVKSLKSSGTQFAGTIMNSYTGSSDVNESVCATCNPLCEDHHPCSSLAAERGRSCLIAPHSARRSRSPELDTLVPKQVGQWRVFQSPVIQVSLTDGTANNINQPYDQTVMRTYVDPQGHAIQLALA